MPGAGSFVDLADNGKIAVDAFNKKHYDLILMDIQMPMMDGYEATRRIRECEKERKAQSSRLKETESVELSAHSMQHPADARRAPIIAMTAHAAKSDRERCLQVGMNDYITKPFRRKELLNIVIKWFKSAGEANPLLGPDLPMDVAMAHNAPNQTSRISLTVLRPVQMISSQNRLIKRNCWYGSGPAKEYSDLKS